MDIVTKHKNIMKIFKNLLLVLLLSSSALFAQQIPEPDDLPIDDSLSLGFELIETYGGASKSLDINDVKIVNLRTQTPPIGNMGNNAPSAQSLTWAISRAMTMAHKLPPADALSPHFLFDLLSKANAKCQLVKGRYMAEIQQILKEEGNIRQREYSPSVNCFKRPDLDDYRSKKHYYANVNVIVPPNAKLDNEQIIYAIKNALKSGLPVVALMNADAAFRTLRGPVWIPDGQSELFGHVVVIVGYNDKTQQLEIANCWGQNWADNGFCKIRYKDLFLLKHFYKVTTRSDFAVARAKIEKRPQPRRSTTKVKETQTIVKTTTTVITEIPAPTEMDLHGVMKLRYPLSYDQNNGFLFEDVNVSLKDGVYQAGKWEKGQQFQLMVSGLTPNSHLYLVSIDAQGKAELHWPIKSNGSKTLGIQAMTSKVNDSATHFVLPKPRPDASSGQLRWIEQAFTKTEEGTDIVLMLHASEELADEDLEKLMERINGVKSENGIKNAIQEVFGKVLINSPKFEANQINYTARSDKGYIVPVLLRVD
jgi:Papain family cysteine protease